ncbi:rhodanese-related sulfurtransferase [Sphingomonas sp. H39-1-10]|uniref:oxygen-dependent tRNA uridine(34) hydroxylase TrhO n=1 Tax=Sphingomonas pollutisoli TaxID=3030829 RepID=UPI0023B97279|nr:rhodanese-related sulfurtransferase [Sphingomonas pollutisoli]MDF0486634.1 rhodanese-related sulfurtransferase [Sphingomonas pollutisoli]
MNAPLPIRVAALYRFARFDDPATLRARLHDLCAGLGIKGTLLLAREGINGTIAGGDAAIETVVTAIRALPGCAGAEIKYAHATEMPFHRLKVRLKREIVTMGEPEIDPLEDVGTYVAPADWNALIARPDTVVIDTRNAYEVRVGSFEGAIDPGTDTFSDFPRWFREHQTDLAGKTIAMFCTGGIRCEKATAFVKAQGFDSVFHLHGGILKYLEEVPAEESRWQGECFVFDERVAVGHGLSPGSHALCRACRMPVSPEDLASPLYEEGVSCPACHGTRDAEKRARLAERHRQVKLAESRGEAHVGAAPKFDPRS